MALDRLVIRDESDRATAVARAAEVLGAGGLLVFPTETVYGVGARADHDDAMSRLAALLGEPASDQPWTLHLPSVASAHRLLGPMPGLVRYWLGRMWPGPITVVLELPHDMVKDTQWLGATEESVRPRLVRQGVMSLRCPDHPLTQALLEKVPYPIVAAGVAAGRAPTDGSGEVARQIEEGADMVLDAGPSRYGRPSTVIRIGRTGRPDDVHILREGVYSERFIRKMLNVRILFVCTGNTCRSPMAEAVAQALLSQKHQVRSQQLPEFGIEIGSAGVYGEGSVPASQPAQEAVRRMGLDLADHRSRELTAEMIHQSDLIFCMTSGHRDAILRQTPEAESKVHLLVENDDIVDPYGSDLPAYVDCLEQIRAALDKRLEEFAL